METRKKLPSRRGFVLELLLIFVILLLIIAVAGGSKNSVASGGGQPSGGPTPGALVTQRERLSYRLEKVRERRAEVARMSPGEVKDRMLKELDTSIAEIEKQISEMN